MKYNTITSILITLFSTLILQNCSTICTVGTTAIISTAWNDPRDISTQLDDNILEIYISRTLHKHENFKKSTRIINTVYQGNVLLTGQTLYDYLSEEATQIVMNVYGTKKVYNAIRYAHPINFKSILIDSWISNQIRLNFFLHKDIHISNIRVVTENKEVFLLGKITHIEEQHAIKIAQSIKGVKKVFSIFTYT